MVELSGSKDLIKGLDPRNQFSIEVSRRHLVDVVGVHSAEALYGAADARELVRREGEEGDYYNANARDRNRGHEERETLPPPVRSTRRSFPIDDLSNRRRLIAVRWFSRSFGVRKTSDEPRSR